MNTKTLANCYFTTAISSYLNTDPIRGSFVWFSEQMNVIFSNHPKHVNTYQHILCAAMCTIPCPMGQGYAELNLI